MCHNICAGLNLTLGEAVTALIRIPHAGSGYAERPDSRAAATGASIIHPLMNTMVSVQ